MKMSHHNEFPHVSNKYLLNAHYLADGMLGANFAMMTETLSAFSQVR